MAVLPHRHRPLAEWTLDRPGFRHRLDRRAVFGSALAAGTATLLLGGKPAAAFSIETLPPTLLGAIPERDGVLPWRTLAGSEIRHGEPAKIPSALAALDGKPVVIEGHMMALDDPEHPERFLLTAYRAHCPFCMPGAARSLVAVEAEAAVPLADKPVAMRGTFHLIAEPESYLIYRLDQATPA